MCQHEPRRLFQRAEYSVSLRLAQALRHRDFYECAKCGAVGYPGRRRMRWGCLMAESIKADAEKWNAIVQAEDKKS